MTIPIENPQNSNYSRGEIQKLLEKGAFRGYKVNRLLIKFEKDQDAELNYDSQNQTISLISQGKTLTIHLKRIEKSNKICTFSRFIYNLKSSDKKNLYVARLQKLVTQIYPSSKTASVSEDPSKPPFQPEHLITLKAVAKKNPSLKSCKYNKKLDRLEFENCPLSIKINSSGDITGVFIDGVRKQFIPESYFPLIQEAITKSSIFSSSYTLALGTIFIDILERDIKESPTHHLAQLSSIIDRCATKKKLPVLLVSHLKSNLKSGVGTDANGISRNYLDDLFANIIAKEVIPLNQSKTVLAFPLTETPFTDNTISHLSADEKEKYYQLGQVLMYCYLSGKKQNYCIGQRFDESIFRAAFSLTDEEIDTPFAALSIATYRKLCEELVDAEILKNPQNFSLIRIKCAFPVLEWEEKDPLPSDSTLINAYNVLGEAGFPEFDFFTTDDAAMLPDIKKIKNPIHSSQFMTLAKQAVLTLDFNTMPPLAQRLAPIHELAKGMKFLWEGKAKHWGEIDHTEFNNKVQGSLNRKTIVNMFELKQPNNEVIKKVGWLKEWILDKEKGASPEELQSLLKFMTGSSSLVPGIKLIIETQTTSPAPISETCFYTIKIANIPTGHSEGYNDHTKEAFIQCLKEVCLQGKDPGFTVRF